MRSAEVYKEARRVLAPWCKQRSFKRISGGMLGWVKPKDDNYILFWLQCNWYGWDSYAGSSFVVDFKFSSSPQIGVFGADLVWHRLPYFLTDKELERVREMQNRVIGKLQEPPSDYFILKLEDPFPKWYLEKFKPVERPYTSRDDIWLRYKDANDVRMWSEFLVEVLPKAIEKLIIEAIQSQRSAL